MRALLAAALSLLALTAQAVDIAVVGLFPGKAVLVVNNGVPRAYSVGSTVHPGVTLVSANESGAVLEVGGRRRKIPMGQHAGNANSDNGMATLSADGRGHFTADGQINGGSVRMLVDTGATLIALSAYDAKRLGIDYKNGRPGRTQTANGQVPVYLVRLDKVKVGGIVLHQVDALVQERGLHQPLLGMSFLNRTEMRRDGDTMVLKKRY
ncbi:MAG: TIGR02281 family clan AA aspartic protease [Burkholderiaceae bacterium]|nr:TIGR02281 family clan AA aspartic protease [Burkholderiaceae bacterium]